MNQSFDELEALTKTMSQALVDYPDDIEMVSTRHGESLTLEVLCRPSDRGSLIGSKGKLAEAMRTVLIAASSARGVYINVLFAPSSS